MLLVMIGYDAEHENLTGTDWAIHANVRASQKDLYADIDGIDPAAPLTREHAAQMMYNALNAVQVRYDYKLAEVDGELHAIPVALDMENGDTILSGKFQTKK
ncbi:hypothetical protein SDC9_161486 [bioreactor metagenome]|uniref:Uncharacterized protein n=1 Tax=bioreactor metagenome TaxID=1076179 RepID=A0A645FJL6_9ZZZZ